MKRTWRRCLSQTLGPFVLTELLMGELQKTSGRVVMLSSGAHKFVSEQDLQNQVLRKSATTMGSKTEMTLLYRDMPVFHGVSGAMKAYGFSKLCNIWQVCKWHRLYHSTGVTFNAVHPGAVQSELVRDLPIGIKQLAQLFTKIMFLTAEQGARTSVHVAASPSVVDSKVSGLYFEACKPTPTSTLAQVTEYQDLLYDQCKPFLLS